MSTQTPIKTKHNPAKGIWQVVKKTKKGAWEVMSNQTYKTQQTADLMIDWYLKAYPLSYRKA